MSTSATSAPIYVSEGMLQTAKKDQGFDYRMLSSCFTITAKLSDHTSRGAHFAHFGQEAVVDGVHGKSPVDLLGALHRSLQAAKSSELEVTELQVIGNLELWSPDYLGLPSKSGVSLAESGVQKALLKKLEIPKAFIMNTSEHDYVHLEISPTGHAKIQFPKGDKKGGS